ncbi:MAG: DUF5320 domain-containing protein [Bacilli bacterium]|nr:DUF5320 domain-containing protein [Bacilli bacterium]MBN2696197.1 DUF5320 domain-containing protein [Bacilli bacterium]
MPGGDRTGPLGRGSMTGRGMGYCATSGRTFGNARYGGRAGRGYGLGFPSRFYAYPAATDPVATKADLEAEKADLQARLNEIENLIKKA